MDILLFIVVVLLIVAILDLVVGVSNDAVNFLNSAIGSKVAPLKTILFIASIGIVFGSLFSSGIMEIARKGIFYPSFFTLDQILFIFLAVVLADIVLLDIFNSLGLPTSTTVSIVFELLGAGLIAGVVVSMGNNMPINIDEYINMNSVVKIISGIFLSILFAFTGGLLIQSITRRIFTFNFENNLKKYGSILTGIGLTSILYFLLIKGLKGSTLVSKETLSWIQENTKQILVVLFVISTATSLFIQFVLKSNPLKFLVLSGTFALAMAFAGNDLVNFIGVPVSGLIAYQNWVSSGIPLNESYQTFLGSNDVIVPNYMLLISGIVMATTLWFSSKSRNVTKTEVSLANQGEGEERFQPSTISRRIVKTTFLLSNSLKVILPLPETDAYKIKPKKSKVREATIVNEGPAFDLVRASINLVLASSLIALATSYKLPLSTTYVTFMVAMGTSLADRAWGRESAVYRVAGVLSVIGGWFITAIIAFVISSIFVLILLKGGNFGLFGLIGLVGLYLGISHFNFKQKEKKQKVSKDKLAALNTSTLDVYKANKEIVLHHLNEVNSHITTCLNGLASFDEKSVEEVYNSTKTMFDESFKFRVSSIRYIKQLGQEDMKEAHILLSSTDLLQDITNSLHTMSQEVNYYVKNLHETPDENFITVINLLSDKMDRFLTTVINSIGKDQFINMEAIKTSRDDVRLFINREVEQVLKNIVDNDYSTKQAMLQTTILLQCRDILAVTLRIMKMYKAYLSK